MPARRSSSPSMMEVKAGSQTSQNEPGGILLRDVIHLGVAGSEKGVGVAGAASKVMKRDGEEGGADGV